MYESNLNQIKNISTLVGIVIVLNIASVAAVDATCQFAKVRPQFLVARAKSSTTSPELSLLKKESIFNLLTS